MTEKLYHFIGGKRVDGTSGKFGDVFNPATGEVESKVPLANASDVDQAVQSGMAAFKVWSQMSAPRRSQVMF
ncbi:MAG: aldehyde dehydrogenase family protein, partial [Alphaproteobacteria bacterium]|nr:aldehyde dehydrogenase family protein [Alphaproteobacteria bacterium]